MTTWPNRLLVPIGELISNNRVQEFVDILAVQFDTLAELIPVIDEIFAASGSK
jgi:hypothetical protein